MATLNDKRFYSIIESTVVAGKWAQVVCNPDGSNVGASVTVSADTEFPAAAPLADNFANPTTTSVFALGGVWDGSTWDRSPGNSTDGLLVNLGANNDIIATGNVASGATDSGNPVKVGGKYNSTPPTLTDGQRGDLQLDSAGNLKVNLATQLDETNDKVQAALKASATATGCDTYFSTTLAATATSVKASAGSIYGWDISNGGGANLYIQIFDLATGSVTPGTTTPKMSILVPAGGGNDKTFSAPITFGTAMTIIATTTSTGSSAPGTSPVVNILYK